MSPGSSGCDLSVVVPAFDEEARLGATLDATVDYLDRRGLRYEIVVVDDGSTDGTAEIARRFAERGVVTERLRRNRGKGAAVRRGVARSRGGLVLICDADLATPIEELAALEERLEDAPLAFGSRALPQSRIELHQPFYRELMGKTFNRILWLLGVRGMRDTQCGFKLCSGEVARQLFELLTVDRFAWDAELVWLARRFDIAIAEVPVAWRHVEESKVRLVADSARMLLDVLRFRWRHRRLGNGPSAARRPWPR